MKKISSYPLPEEFSLPKSSADWKLDPLRSAILVHDMQRYFLDFFGAGESPMCDLIVNTQQLLLTARSKKMPVFYTAQPGDMTRKERGLLQNIWGPGMSARCEDKQIIPQIAPTADDYVLTKWRYSAFFNSDFLSVLRTLERDQLIICGVYAHIGCLCTAIEAFSNDIETFFIADAVADFCEVQHRVALEIAAETCAVVLSTHQAVVSLGKTN